MAIDPTNFFRFLEQTRSPIGFVDNLNLGEVNASDQRDALRNLLLNPEGLDQISGLARGGVGSRPLLKEDIRLIGGLESRVIDSLGLIEDVKPKVTFELSTFIRVGSPIGEPEKKSLSTNAFSDNIIVHHGGLAAKNIEYDVLDIDGVKRTVSVSTSRESLFNAESNSDGEFTDVSFPGLIRSRRRSHVNEIKLREKLFVKKGSITESPGAIVRIPTYLQTSASGPNPDVKVLNTYATKGSPLEIPINKIGECTFEIGTILSISSAYYFGFEVKRKSDGRLIISKQFSGNNVQNKPESIRESFDLTTQAGGIGNGVDCILSIFCVPSLVKELNLQNLGISDGGQRDIGLIGFDNLERLNLQNNNLQALPTWLKVNYKTLTFLNLSGNPFWNNGPVKFFDSQVISNSITGRSSSAIPQKSATQILAYSGHIDSSDAGSFGTDAQGKYELYDGSLGTARDKAGELFVNKRQAHIDGSAACAIDEENGFRVFERLETLVLGSSFLISNGDFSELFPNLSSLQLQSPANGGDRVAGLLPKVFNSENEAGFSYDINQQRRVSGNIKYLGSTTRYQTTLSDEQKAQYIGQFPMRLWDTELCGFLAKERLAGGIATDDSMIANGKVNGAQVDGSNAFSSVDGGNASIAWSKWLERLENINIRFTDIAFCIANGDSSDFEWKELKTLNTEFTGLNSKNAVSKPLRRTKIRYNEGVTGLNESSVDKLRAPKLSTIKSSRGHWGGKMFSLDGNNGLGGMSLKTLNISAQAWEGYEAEDGSGVLYFLPKNFAPTNDIMYALEIFQAESLLNKDIIDLEFRPNDFERTPRLRFFDIRNSGFTGVFPNLVAEKRPLDLRIDGNRFYDLDNIGPRSNSNIVRIFSTNQGILRGGSIIPDFSEPNNDNKTLFQVVLNGSLPSKYTSVWKNDPTKARTPVFNALFGLINAGSNEPANYNLIVKERNTAAGATWTSKNRAGVNQQPSEFLYPSISSLSINGYVRVGDKVYKSENGTQQVGVVKQIKSGAGAYIVLSDKVDFSSHELWFQRGGVDAGDYFNKCKNLKDIIARDCSLVGRVPKFRGNSGRLATVDLASNLLFDYQKGTLQEITGRAEENTNPPALQVFNLSNNPLTKASIRKIIEDAFDVAEFYGDKLSSKKLVIDLTATKANIAEGSYSNYTLDEIFDQGKPGNPNSEPPIDPISDNLLEKFNQLNGNGNNFSRIKVLLN